MLLATVWLLISVASLVGCAAVTNPVANGVPVYLVPDELLAPSKEGFERIDLTLLRQPPPEEYLLAPGDTLGVYVEGVIGDPESPLPVGVPDSPEVPPSIGFPFPIRANGTVSLPFIGAIGVDGLSIEAAEQKVVDAYLKKQIVRAEDYRIIVTLLRPRFERILVVREDAGQAAVSVSNTGLIGFGTQTTISGGRSATGEVVELPAYQNDVLNALARTGGLPGPDARQEVVIYRGERNGESNPPQLPTNLDDRFNDLQSGRGEVIRIPLEVPGGMQLPIDPDAITLKTGDIITVRARKPEFYYTGGLIPSSEYQLPFDRDVTVVEAIIMARGPVINGGLNTSNLSGSIVGVGVGNPSPSLVAVVRKTPAGSQIVIRVDLNEALRDPRHNLLVQAEDVIILQENTDEAITRYITNVFQMDLFFRWLNRSDATGTGSLFVP